MSLALFLIRCRRAIVFIAAAPPLLLLLALVVPARAAERLGAAQPPLAQAETALGSGAIVVGILSYTAWPGEARTIQVCVTRGAVDAPDIVAQIGLAKPSRPVVARTIEADQAVPPACDAVYFGAWDAEALRAALRGLSTRPVLTLGRGPGFCSDGGMFCLEAGTPGMRFEVNLDAVARSGLRVSPLVLRLAKPRVAAS